MTWTSGIIFLLILMIVSAIIPRKPGVRLWVAVIRTGILGSLLLVLWQIVQNNPTQYLFSR